MQPLNPNQIDENGVPQFEPVSFYDAPATLLTQIWDGEGSFARAVRTLAHSESLSPTERDSYAQRLKKSYGGNALTDTAIDIATNPFTWLLLAISPVGVKQFRATGGKLFQGLADARAKGQKTFVFLSEMARVMKMSNLLNMGETTAPALIAQSIGSRWDVLSRLEGEVLAPSGRTIAQAREALVTKLGVKDLDHTRSVGDTSKLLHEVDVMSNLYATGALKGGKAVRTETTQVRGGTFRPVVGGTPTGEAVPMLVNSEDFAEMTKRFKEVRPGDRVLIGGVEHEVGEHGVIVANDSQQLKKLRKLFPKEERAKIPSRIIERADEDMFNVDVVDESFFKSWAQSRGIHDELVDYLEGGKALREEMKKRIFYKLDEAGNPLPGNELDTEKILNMWLKWQNKRGKGVDMSPHEWAMFDLAPMEELDRILPEWAKNSARRGSSLGVKEADLQALIREKMELELSQSYLPRNNFMVYRKQPLTGVVSMGPTHSDALVRGRESVVDSRGIASLVVPRRGEGIPWDPQDLGVIRRLIEEQGIDVASTQVTFPKWAKEEPVSLDKAIDRMTRTLDSKFGVGRTPEHAVTHAMGYEMNMRNYMRDAMGTVILHGARIPESLYKVLEEAIQKPSPQLRGAYRGKPLPGTAMTPKQMAEMGLTPEAITNAELTFPLPETLKRNPQANAYRTKLVEAHAQLGVVEAMPAGEARTAALERAQRNVNKWKAQLERLGEMRSQPAQVLLTGARPYMTVDDAIETVLRVESPEVQDYFKRIVLPGLFGGASPTSALELRMSQGARAITKRVADSPAGLWVERNGGEMGKGIIKSMREYGELSGYALDAAQARGGLTGYLYATHLGFNTVSAVWNMLQPLQWAMTWMGGEHILKGYASAFKQLGGYYAERIAKHGLGRMSAQEQMALWQKHIRLAGPESGGRDLLGMGHDAISAMEGHSFMRRPEGKPSLAKWLMIDTPMAMFQAAEAINRITVAEATMGWLGQLESGLGRRIAGNEKLDFAQLMQSMSNFNYSPVTQLQAFQKGGVLGNSLARMFLQYPSRSLTNVLFSGQIGGGTRSFGLQRVGGPSMEIPAMIGDLSRMVGISAVAYEIGKNMFNINLSSGLGGAAVGQLSSQFMTKGIPVPPVIDIPAQLIGSLMDQDREQFRQAAFRLLPGGVALQKALGAFPALPGGGNFGIIQGQYADWNNKNQQGDVPIYNSDGMLQGFESPLSLVMKGVGADFKRFKSPQEATKFLLANRQEMVDLRRQYKDAVLGNNMSAASGIEAEYKKRYGVPMTVKPGEWDRAVSMREVPVSERMLDTMPEEVRGLYQQALQGPEFARAMGLPEGGIMEGDTASQRESIRRFNAPVTPPTSQ